MTIKQHIQEAIETERQAEQAMFEALIGSRSSHVPLVSFEHNSYQWTYTNYRGQRQLYQTGKGAIGYFDIQGKYHSYDLEPQYEEPLIPYPVM